MTAVNAPDVPARNSIESVTEIVSVNPSKLTACAVGAVGRLGKVTLIGADGGFPPTALTRILSVTSADAAEAGIIPDISSKFAAMVTQPAPLALNSKRFDTPVKSSLCTSRATPDGDAVKPGTSTFIIADEGAEAVALVRTITVLAVSPSTVRDMLVELSATHDAPLSRLYSIEAETPVILSVSELYRAFGAALRAGIDIERVADTNVVSVALTRTWQRWEDVPAFAGILVDPAGTGVKSTPDPILNSIESVTVTVSVNPSNLTTELAGVAGRRGSVMFVGSDAGFPPAALIRMLSVMSSRALAAGISADMSSVSEVIFLHLVPFVLYSMRLDTPVTVSLRVLSKMFAVSPGRVVAAAGTATSLILDEGADAVALVRTMTVTAALPIALLGMFEPVTSAHESPPLRLNSIERETPVILSVEPLYTAFGADLRLGTVTERIADAKVVSVALTRT